MRTLLILTALLFLAGCSEFEFQLTASPEPGVAELTRIPAPAAGERVEVVVEPGQIVCLDVPDLKDARVGLLIVLPNGGEIFWLDPESELLVPLCLAGGLAAIAPGAGLDLDLPDDDLLSQDGDGGNGGGNGGDTDVSSDDGNDNRSGLGDGTNPGGGGGTGNSPNDGTDNPNNSNNG